MQLNTSSKIFNHVYIAWARNRCFSCKVIILSTISVSTSPESRTFVDDGNAVDERRPVQVQDVEEDEVARRSHKLDELLRDSLADEYMNGDNQYQCMQCGILRVRQFFIKKS